MPHDVPSTPSNTEYQSLSGCLLRAIWIGIGNVLLVFCLIAIVRHQGQMFSLADGVFWGVVLLQILLYYVDIRWLDGVKILDVHPTRLHRFPLIFSSVCVTAWLLTHLIRYLLSGGSAAM